MGGLATGPPSPPDARDAPARPWRPSKYSDRLLDYANACERFERDWSGYLRIRLDEDVLGAARLVIQRHALRGFDGIHLASALTLQNRWDETVVVVAADQRLLRAAAAEGLATLDIETGAATRRARRR